MYTFDAWETTSYLAHYGVLGMKWGVRKDPKAAYQKASKKLTKLNDAAFQKKGNSLKSSGKDIKAQEKVQKLERKRSKQEKILNNLSKSIKSNEYWMNQMEKEHKKGGEAYRNELKWRDKSAAKAVKYQKKLETTNKRLAKAKAKAEKIMLNAKKSDLKSAKASYKAEKWGRQMLNAFGEMSMEELRKKYA